MKKDKILSHDEQKRNFLLDVSKRIEIDKIKSVPLNSRSAAGYYLTWYYLFAPEEYACVIYLDKNDYLIRSSPLQTGYYKHTDSIPDKIMNEAKSYKAKSFILAHNHKDRPLVPSPEDVVTTEFLREFFENKNINFLEHYIISGFDYITLLSQRYSARGYGKYTCK